MSVYGDERDRILYSWVPLSLVQTCWCRYSHISSSRWSQRSTPRALPKNANEFYGPRNPLAESQRQVLPFLAHVYDIIHVALSHDSALLAVGSSDGTIRLWDSAIAKLR